MTPRHLATLSGTVGQYLHHKTQTFLVSDLDINQQRLGIASILTPCKHSFAIFSWENGR